MGNPRKPKEVYRFGIFSLDAAELCLWREDEPIQLTPKQFDLLFYFVENAGRVAKKSELLDAVWADTFVEESTLARNISWLRSILGESFIETVPKVGYRFTADVVRPDGNLLVIEEESIQYTRGEETITFDDEAAQAILGKEPRTKAVAAPSKPSRSWQSFITPMIVVLALAVGLLAGVGFVGSKTDELSKKTSKPARNLNLSDGSAIKIGSVVHLQNRYPNDGSYLDAWGAVWSKPEFSKVPTETMFVSTHRSPDRENGSGSWEIVSESGKSDGDPLVVGDRIHLKNMYPDAGYLDACGWVEHLRVFEKFTDHTGAVFTTKSPNRDNGTGVWIVRSATLEDGTPVFEGDSIAIESSYFINDKGKNRLSGFLNVTGQVKDIPTFSDYDGSKLVFTQSTSYNQPIPDVWTVTISKNFLERKN
ncbi:MAG: transcriptional regulator [Acidobacteria bacterium]|nr:transcriptional regulator [Acidobacteriota bacterium]